MIKKKLVYVSLSGAMMFFILLLSSCSAEKPYKQLKSKVVEPQGKTAPEKNVHDKGGSNIQKLSWDTLTSGVTAQVPWESDENFKKVQQQNGTMEMMAAYRTVLRDPLPGEEYNVHLAARLLAGKVVKPGEVFSQNEQIGPYTESRGFKIGPVYIGSDLKTTIGGGVCKIASTLYNVTVLSNLEVVERHNHSMPVPYVPYGQDATVYYGVHDFKFLNNTASPVLIWAQGLDNILYMGFYGKEKPAKVEWHHEKLNTQKPPTVYRNNPSLPSGIQKKVADGMEGAAVRSWVTIEYSDGTKTSKELAKSYYDPFPNIIEKGE